MLQSLLQLPEQERFVKTITFLQKRVSKLQVTYMHYKTIEHNLKLIRQHTIYHEIKWHTRIKLLTLSLGRTPSLS